MVRRECVPPRQITRHFKTEQILPRQFIAALVSIVINRAECCIVPSEMEGVVEVSVGGRCIQYVMSCNGRPNGATPASVSVKAGVVDEKAPPLWGMQGSVKKGQEKGKKHN